MTETELQNRILGYTRVSTYGQMLDAQLAQLKAAGCARIYREKATGAKPERRELQRLLKAIQPGDVVTVTRIDRLARSTFDLFGIVKAITDAGGNSGHWRSRGPIARPAPGGSCWPFLAGWRMWTMLRR